MKRWVLGMAVGAGILIAGVADLSAGAVWSPEMNKLNPLAGKWKTESTYPESGLKVPGDLEYSYVLGGHWLMVRFIGHHPERSYWEAVAMIKYDHDSRSYVSFSFFNRGDPVRMTGDWISETTIRFSVKEPDRSWGIDYTAKEDGTIFQENWLIGPSGLKKITLQTRYVRAESRRGG